MIDETRAWAAVQKRDASFDGHFLFAVTSTGIYCRPSCPARRPARERVRFFSRPEDARQSGFRACRRCRPDQEMHAAAEAIRTILDGWNEAGPTLAQLARATGLSAGHLQRVFKKAFSISPHLYMTRRRAAALKRRLKMGEDVTTAIYESGYGSSTSAYAQAGKHLAMTPATYRRGGEGATIRYTILGVSLGRLLIGTTERGVCALALGDDDHALLTELREEYPLATLLGDDRSALIATTVAAVEGDARAADALPLDLHATAFQLRVWEALRQIPPGETRSYAELAGAIGLPAAARAVASACAGNRVAVVIPCHRVVRQDGAAGGYRWGVARKKALLEREEKS